NGDQPYSHSLTLSDLIKPDAAKQVFSHLFTKPFCLIDLATIEDDTLREYVQGRVKGIALLMALKHVFDSNLQAFFEQTLIKALRQLDQAGDSDEVVDVIYYLLNENEFLNGKRFWDILHRKFSPRTEAKIMTIAQQLRQEGMREGMREGMQQGIQHGIEKTKIEFAKQLLAENPGLSKKDLIALINRLTGFTVEKVLELEKDLV
ncbi:MAG: hypothetical protein EPO11_08600, partial [Gammaproteobacteria bacterium]